MLRFPKKVIALLLCLSIILTIMQAGVIGVFAQNQQINLLAGISQDGDMSVTAHSSKSSNSGAYFLNHVATMFDSDVQTATFSSNYYLGPHIIEVDLGSAYDISSLEINHITKVNDAPSVWYYASDTSLISIASTNTTGASQVHSITYSGGEYETRIATDGRYISADTIDMLKSNSSLKMSRSTTSLTSTVNQTARYFYFIFGNQTELGRLTELNLYGEKVKPNENVIITYDANTAVSGNVPSSYEGSPSNFTPAGNSGNLQKPGYTFGGWAISPGIDKLPIPNDHVVYNDLTLYAVWIANDYTLTFDYNDETSAPGTAKIRHLYPIGDILPVPSQIGYSFGGWYTDKTYTTQVTSFSAFEDNTTVYAKWFPAWKISFNADGGSNTNAVYVQKGLTATAPINPTRNFYIFDGWYTDKTFTEKINWSVAPTSDITLIAKWKLPVATVDNTDYEYIIIDGKENTLTGGTPNLINGITSENGYDMKTGNAPYTFEVSFSQRYNIGAVQLYKGMYLNFPPSVDVFVADENGDYPTTPNLTINTNSSPTDAKWGYLSSPISTTKVKFVSHCPGNSTTTFRISELSVFGNAYNTTITYDANGGLFPGGLTTLTDSYTKVLSDTRVVLPVAPNRAGYTFAGWYYDSDCTQSPFSTADFTSTPISVYAKWTTVSNVNAVVKIHGAEGSIIDGVAINTNVYNKSISSFTSLHSLTPTKSGFRFDGWFADEHYATPISDGLVLFENLILYAKFTPVYTVTYYLDHLGTVYRQYVFDTDNQTIKIPNNPSQVGYVFTDWQYNGSVLNGNITVSSDMNIYANLGFSSTPVSIKITPEMFSQTAGGSTVDPLEYAYDGINSTCWWATDSSTGAYAILDLGAYYDLTSVYIRTTWKKGEVINFSNYESNEQICSIANSDNVIYQMVTFTPNAQPVRFVKISTNEGISEFTLTGYISRAITKYRVDFEMGAGEEIPSCIVNEGRTLPKVVPFSTTTVFNGWFTDPDFTIPFNHLTTPITSNLVLYASWYSIPTSDFSYTVNNGQVTITGYKGTGYTIVIPSSIDGYTVTKIEDRAFQKTETRNSIVTLIIPNTVKEIGNYAFAGNVSLSTILLPVGLEKIGSYAFQNCTSITEIVIPDTVYELGDFCFSDCYSLINVKLPRTLTSIPNHCFSGCISLPSIVLPDYINYIGKYAFYGCLVLQNINIPDGVTAINDFTFSSCRSLTNIVLPGNITYIGDESFYECGFSAVILPAAVNHIGNGAFSRCESLTSITIPTNVTSIGSEAFSYCKLLSQITLPANLKTIGKAAFHACTSLVSIALPPAVTVIEDHAFYGCAALTNFSMNNNITKIGARAFFNNKLMSSIILPIGLTEIGDYAFYNCNNLGTILVPSTVTTLGNSALNTSGLNYSLAKNSESNKGKYFIDTAYSSIDWANTKQYKGNMHAHSLESDGVLSTDEVFERYYARGYEVMALTDHNILANGYDVTKSLINKSQNTLTSTSRLDEMIKGVGREGTGSSGVTFMRYSNEQSKHSHINTYGANYICGGSSSLSILDRLKNTLANSTLAGGFIIYNHPGFVSSSSELGEIPETDPLRATTFAEHFKNYGAMLGCEPVNRDDRYSFDRNSWDRMLAILMPQGRKVWGFANDDSHHLVAIGLSYNMLLMSENTESSVRSAYEVGSSYMSSKYNRATNETSGTSYVLPPFSYAAIDNYYDKIDHMTPPTISAIDVDQINDSITITTANSTDYIKWYTGNADGNYLLNSISGYGSNYGNRTIDINNLPADEKAAVESASYVRAIIVNEGGTSWTQPMGIYINPTIPQPEFALDEIEMFVNETTVPVINGGNASDYNFSSNDSLIASVDNHGLITAVSEGTTTIIVITAGGSDTITIKVSSNNSISTNILGAQIRVDSLTTQGFRFIAKATKPSLSDTYTNVKYGILILPYDKMQSAGLTANQMFISTVASGANVNNADCTSSIIEDSDGFRFSAVQLGFSNSAGTRYDRVLNVRSYIQYTDQNNVVKTLYSDAIQRSVYSVSIAIAKANGHNFVDTPDKTAAQQALEFVCTAALGN